jgi:hypothetical protein
VWCDPLTIQAIKSLAATKRQSMGRTLDQAVEYFSRKIVIEPDKPLHWQLPEDY